MIAALVLAATLAAPLTPAECAQPARVRAGWDAVMAAMQAGPDLPAAKAAMDAIIACGDIPAAIPPRALRADIASKEGDDALVLNLLSPTPVPPGPLGAQAGWLLMRTYAKLGDQDAFNVQRTRLLAATDYALGDPSAPLKGRLVERFEVGNLRVSAYQAPVQHATARRLFQFIVLADKPMAEPESILVTEDSQMTEMARVRDPAALAPIYFDRYGCNLRSSLRVLRGTPTFAEAKAVVIDELTRHPDLSLGAVTPPPSQGAGCRWPVFTTPGLGD